MVQYNYEVEGQKALMLNLRWKTGTRAKIVASRSGLQAECTFIEELTMEEAQKPTVMIVDEAQFLTKAQVQLLVDIVDKGNVPVICYGLRADFRGNLFEGSHWLLAWADSIENQDGMLVRQKSHLQRKADQRSGDQGRSRVLLGGNESYIALCRKHWASGEPAGK